MGWRLHWTLSVERDPDDDRGDGEFNAKTWPRLFRWAIVGLALVGPAVFLIVRELT